MPCSDSLALDRMRFDDHDYCNETINQLKKNADAATRAACDMRTILRRNNMLSQLTVETRRWITQHDRVDAERIAKEEAKGLRQRVKQQALNKLTLEERRVLGL